MITFLICLGVGAVVAVAVFLIYMVFMALLFKNGDE